MSLFNAIMSMDAKWLGRVVDVAFCLGLAWGSFDILWSVRKYMIRPPKPG